MGIRWPSNKTLGKITVYGAVASVSAVFYMKYKIENRIRNQIYFKDALKFLRGSPGVVKLIGEPIKENGIDLSDAKKTFCDGKTAEFQVAIKGSKDRGTMFFWSERSDDKGWILKRLELEVKSQPDKRFIVLKEEMSNVSTKTEI